MVQSLPRVWQCSSWFKGSVGNPTPEIAVNLKGVFMRSVPFCLSEGGSVSGSASASASGLLVNARGAFRHIVTAHSEMRKVFSVVDKVARSGSTVLILGESGTGKELIARAVHDLSGVKGHFVPVNCGAIPDNLLESELFGYEKGAFTGATTSKPGRFILADGGTIFLDEIGEMSPHLQVKLLRVLQEQEVEAVGGLRAKKINVRVIAATNVNLLEAVRNGRFREDLYYRLQVVPVHLPALRQRSNDIPLLINYFAEKFSRQRDHRPLVFSPQAMELLTAYNWPGNIRELENLTERLSILLDGDAVYPDDLPEYLGASAYSQSGTQLPVPVIGEDGVSFNELVEEFENALITQALERTGGNKKAAARLLNLNRTTLVEKIKKKGIDGFADEDAIAA